MTYISNLLLILLLHNLNLYKELTGLSPKLNYLKVLGSTVYIFVHEINERSSLLNESYK